MFRESSGRERVSVLGRRFQGRVPDAPPLVLLPHSDRSIRSWDPAVLRVLGLSCDVALFENAGADGPAGVDPDGVAELALEAVAFMDALGAPLVDLLGFSVGAQAAQEVAMLRPRLIRRIVLAAVGPPEGSDLHLWAESVDFLLAPDEPKPKPSFVLARQGNVIPIASHQMALRAGALACESDRGSPPAPRTREPRLLGPSPLDPTGPVPPPSRGGTGPLEPGLSRTSP